jgi:hypothetical protein
MKATPARRLQEQIPATTYLGMFGRNSPVLGGATHKLLDRQRKAAEQYARSMPPEPFRTTRTRPKATPHCDLHSGAI